MNLCLLLTKFSASDGKDRMLETPLKKHITKIHPDIYKVPLFRRKYCKMLVDEIKTMQFQTNDDEDELRQIPEIVLKDQVPELYSNLWFVVQTILSPIIYSIWQRNCSDIGSIQIANYNLKDKQQGAWHHDESADISVVIPLNTGNYEGGGTEFHNYGEVAPLPTGHALIFPSFTQMHRGLPVEMGDRYLLVFWLYNRKRMEWLLENGSP
jgi:predicted 2-oxoglutarate/Fe(II)-dependent dioxygenase YbiX